MSLTNNYFRFYEIEDTIGDITGYRTEYRRDYGRVLHSPSFRRLENKTQLFPGYESDFFRNRLTHSLEVAQIAKSIAYKLKNEYTDLDIEPDVCEIAGLIHDIGHPPFGHNGEAALDRCMLACGGFEGNAQTLRIITRLEKKECPDYIVDAEGCDKRVGLNLTARVIASALKYDKEIPGFREKPDLVKGYYQSEKAIVEKVKEYIVGSKEVLSFKTIECSIMDLADDIAYSTYDVEDAFKANFLTPYDMMAADESLYEQIVVKLKINGIETTTAKCRNELIGVFADTWAEPLSRQHSINPEKCDSDEFTKNTLSNLLSSYRYSNSIAEDGYKRTMLTSHLVNRFVNGIKLELNRDHSVLSKVYFDDDTKLLVNILKHFSYVALINSSRLKVAENRGQEIICNIFNRLSKDEGYRLLPEDFQVIYKMMPNDGAKKRVVCDFIAGMTDRYAMEFYRRLFSENPQTIFKPLY